ncbi:MAG: hypothetical protein L0229_05580 [Blastocatellia bacterium]|nr:hypothetical protein [Blastocatellia bacterium]
MNRQNQKPDTHDISDQLPEWLDDVLRMSQESVFFLDLEREPEQVSDVFRQRCHEAAEVALSIAKLRKERQRIGFVPLSLADYIQGLVKVANISLTPILAWMGIEVLSHPDANSAKAFARFAQKIGISLRETLIHLRIGFAARLDSAPISLLVARHRSTELRHNQMEECEVVLRQLESEYELSELREIRQIESEAHSVYDM